MDPLACILPELHDMVLQHLNTTDFLEITEASPNWNEAIGQSRVMMKKVKLAFKNVYKRTNEYNFEYKRTNDKSTRRYLNVSVNFKYASGAKFSNKILMYLADLGPLVELELNHLFDLNVHYQKILWKIDVSRLKVLKLCYASQIQVCEFLNQCSKLNVLELAFLGEKSILRIIPHKASIPGLRAFLETNQSLQEITLRGDEFYEVFFENDITEIVRFHLKSLKIENYTKKKVFPDHIDRNFLKFLEQQSSNLESFLIKCCRLNVLEHAFNRMPALTSLSILSKFNAADLQLTLNEKITDLRLDFIDIPEHFQKIIRFVPKLRKLLVFTLTAARIEIIANNLAELQTLRFFRCHSVNGEPVWASLWPHAVPKEFRYDRRSAYFKSIEK